MEYLKALLCLLLRTMVFTTVMIVLIGVLVFVYYKGIYFLNL